MANYPMTQVYQHEEDSKRGDHTLSIRLGVKATFYFAILMFGVALSGFLLYLDIFHGSLFAWHFLIAITPILLYFFYWLILVIRDKSAADYNHTMWLNAISATCIGGFFIYLFLRTTQLLQLFQ